MAEAACAWQLIKAGILREIYFIPLIPYTGFERLFAAEAVADGSRIANVSNHPLTPYAQ